MVITAMISLKMYFSKNSENECFVFFKVVFVRIDVLFMCHKTWKYPGLRDFRNLLLKKQPIKLQNYQNVKHDKNYLCIMGGIFCFLIPISNS